MFSSFILVSTVPTASGISFFSVESTLLGFFVTAVLGLFVVPPIICVGFDIDSSGCLFELLSPFGFVSGFSFGLVSGFCSSFGGSTGFGFCVLFPWSVLLSPESTITGLIFKLIAVSFTSISSNPFDAAIFVSPTIVLFSLSSIALNVTLIIAPFFFV